LINGEITTSLYYTELMCIQMKEMSQPRSSTQSPSHVYKANIDNPAIIPFGASLDNMKDV